MNASLEFQEGKTVESQTDRNDETGYSPEPSTP